jgi:tetratricopeptide (TPR) repeat protein
VNDPRGTVTQHVTANGGFAYGTIGADIHVHGDDSPLYLLEGHQPPPVLNLAWLRELPSRMLNARSHVVAFTGRQRERDELATWCDGGTRLAVRWLYGPGGQGKTRLADQVATDAAEQGWKVASAVHGAGAARPSPGSQDLRLAGHQGVLLIVDYADRWPVDALTFLLRDALLYQPDVPARVLLLARTTISWPPLRATLQDPQVQASTSEQALAPLASDDGDTRQAMFTAARDSFAAIYGLPDPTIIVPPAELAQPQFGLTLTLHIGALVAVDAHATGARPPADPDQLTRYLLDRERHHWERLYQAHARGLDHDTPPTVMARTVFTAVLTGPLPHPDATTLLGDIEQERPAERILTDHTYCYPPTDPARSTVLEPLYPDRLAEDFLALTLPGHPAGQPGQAWATTRLHQLLQPKPGRPTQRRWWQRHREAPPTGPSYVARAVSFLIAAAARWPHLGPAHLYPLLRARPQLVLTAGGATLAILGAIPGVDLDVLEAVEALLPHDRHVDLDIGAAAISTALIGHRLATTTAPADHARLHATHAWRLAAAGQHQQALTSTEEAVAIWRRLAEVNSATYLPDLAASLGNLGTFLSEVGRRDEALAPAEEAVDLYRRLAEANPAYLPDLATSLVNLGTFLSAVGRREEALAAIEEAVAITRRLAEANPAAYLPNLAASLVNLGTFLSAVGRRDEAVTPTEEAVTIRRRLAEANPAAYLPDLATSLNNLGVWLSHLGRRDEALTPTEEAVTITRRLAEANPAAYLPDLAMSLSNLAVRLSHLGRRDEALTPTEEAVTIRRRLAEANPAAYLPDLAMSLSNLGKFLSEVGRPNEALGPAKEAVDLYRRLAEANPAAYEPEFARALINYGLPLRGMGPLDFLSLFGYRDKALASDEEAVAIWRRLAEANPAAYEPDLATSLRGYAWVCVKCGVNLPEALAAMDESIDLYQSLAERRPELFADDLLSAWYTCVDVLHALGRSDEAAALRRHLEGAGYPPPA